MAKKSKKRVRRSDPFKLHRYHAVMISKITVLVAFGIVLFVLIVILSSL